jgi:hypothetical protein
MQNIDNVIDTLTTGTRAVEVTIGWTKSDRDNDYSSFSDGYRRGADQHTETIRVEVPADRDAEDIAEAVFFATNAPYLDPASREGKILAAIYANGYHGEGAHFSLSTGDTVTVGDTMLACARFGWEVVND